MTIGPFMSMVQTLDCSDEAQQNANLRWLSSECIQTYIEACYRFNQDIKMKLNVGEQYLKR